MEERYIIIDYYNKILSHLIEGIQQNGGEIISLSMIPIVECFVAERIIILYEDNGHYDEIMDFLKGKEDMLGKWIKDI